MAEQKIILPGEVLATEEEYAAGKNTFIQGGKILSKTMGLAEFDDVNKEVRVKGKTIEEITEGDIITGQVMLVKESSASIHLLSAENGKRITGIAVAQLAIRNVSNEYVTELNKKVRIGDVIRARVVGASELGIDLSTKENGLGVVNAYCTNCRTEMKFIEDKLTCPACGSMEERKWFGKEEAPPQYGRREGGFGGGGFRGGRDRGGRGGFGDRRGAYGGRREGGHGSGFGHGGFRGGRSGGYGGRREGGAYGGHLGGGSFGGRDRGSFGERSGRKSFNRPRRQEF